MTEPKRLDNTVNLIPIIAQDQLDRAKFKSEVQGRVIEMNAVEPEVCNVFGCGKRLSLREQLFGKKCNYHTGSNPQFGEKREEGLQDI
jgi:hypothetical protein